MGLTTASLKDLEDKDFVTLYEDHKAVWIDMAVITRDFVIKAIAEDNVYRDEDMLEPLTAALKGNQLFRDHQTQNHAKSSKFLDAFANYIIERQPAQEKAHEPAGKATNGKGVH